MAGGGGMRRVAEVARLGGDDNESEACIPCILGLSFEGKDAFRGTMAPFDVRDSGKGGL